MLAERLDIHFIRAIVDIPTVSPPRAGRERTAGARRPLPVEKCMQVQDRRENGASRMSQLFCPTGREKPFPVHGTLLPSFSLSPKMRDVGE